MVIWGTSILFTELMHRSLKFIHTAAKTQFKFLQNLMTNKIIVIPKVEVTNYRAMKIKVSILF